MKTTVRHHLRRTRTSGVVGVIRHQRGVHQKDKSELDAMRTATDTFKAKECSVCGKSYSGNNSQEYRVCSASCMEEAKRKETPVSKGDDLDLKDLDQYSGTQEYHNVMGANVTDGVAYVMQNGYSWLVTDFIAVAKMDKKLKDQEFLSIKLEIDNGKGRMVVTDGNEKVLYTQKYGYTNAKVPLQMYYTNNTLMLSREY